MKEGLYHFHNHSPKNRREILSDLINCYDELDTDLEMLKTVVTCNSESKSEFKRDLDELVKLDLIDINHKVAKDIEYNLNSRKKFNSNITAIRQSEERDSVDTDLEILKYRKARENIHNQTISILHLESSRMNEIIRAQDNWQLYTNIQAGLDYLWHFAHIPPQILDDFENKHGLTDIILKNHLQQNHLSNIAEADGYTNFRLVGLHYYTDWNIDLNQISLLDITREAIIMIGLTNKPFKATLDKILTNAHHHDVIDCKQLKNLYNYYAINYMHHHDRHPASIFKDIDLVRQFDLNRHPQV